MLPPARDPERILQRLEWTVIRRLDGLLQGNYRTLFRGFGTELAELREYVLSDDVRYIDWYVTARLQTPYVRQYVEDREITAWFLLDLSPSLDFGTVTTEKRTLLADCVGVLARLLTRHGNRVGALFFAGSQERFIPAQNGRNHVLRILEDLLRQPRLARAPMTDLSFPLTTALRMIRRRSLIFLVSDFISAPGWEKPLSLLTQRHELLAVRVTDPRESELPDIGPLVLEDSETGEQLFVDTHDRAFRRRFADAAASREASLQAMLVRQGIDLLSLSTEGDLVAELMRFAQMRRERKKLPSRQNLPRGAAMAAAR